MGIHKKIVDTIIIDGVYYVRQSLIDIPQLLPMNKPWPLKKQDKNF